MHGKGAWRDNVFVERLWRSVEYEEVYLKAYASASEAKTNLSRYFDFYNTRRPHSRLDGRTPDDFLRCRQVPCPARSETATVAELLSICTKHEGASRLGHLDLGIPLPRR
jgi:putative transposase